VWLKQAQAFARCRSAVATKAAEVEKAVQEAWRAASAANDAAAAPDFAAAAAREQSSSSSPSSSSPSSSSPPSPSQLFPVSYPPGCATLLRRCCVRVRLIKSEGEVALLRRVNAVTDAAHLQVTPPFPSSNFSSFSFSSSSSSSAVDFGVGLDYARRSFKSGPPFARPISSPAPCRTLACLLCGVFLPQNEKKKKRHKTGDAAGEAWSHGVPA
jgi:hypothetical protein